MQTMAIIEGWAGGPKLSRQFAKSAQNNGFVLTKDPAIADFVVAHSTGCYMLPGELKAKLIMLIDPPYWPGESIVRRWINMTTDELKFLKKERGIKKFLRDKLWETYYVFAKPMYTWSVVKNQSHLDFLDDLDGKKIIIVRNTADEFCSPEISEVLKGYKNIKYAEVEGYHGNYYLNPGPYLALLLKELG